MWCLTHRTSIFPISPPFILEKYQERSETSRETPRPHHAVALTVRFSSDRLVRADESNPDGLPLLMLGCDSPPRGMEPRGGDAAWVSAYRFLSITTVRHGVSKQQRWLACTAPLPVSRWLRPWGRWAGQGPASQRRSEAPPPPLPPPSRKPRPRGFSAAGRPPAP